ncbi:hypothetical protein O8B93_25850 [Agrobacterium rhizogenes]|uniref:hypothetical protein n=1 Tax=Rhizobium rhizogenes TaxID=359 RepID=UPI0022B73B05|nr:hypothetical protein [Rhizobium rhizogenes]MCZ7450998.1 hypothetical protein [Rhizobium rhizogenes]
MIQLLVLKPLAKSTAGWRPSGIRLSDPADFGARGKAGNDSMVRSRARRRSGPRTLYEEFIYRLTFERWVELDMIACRLAVQERVADDIQCRDHEPVHHSATQADGNEGAVAGLAWLRCNRHGGLGHGSFSLLGIGIGPVLDCPSCSLRSEPAAVRFKAACAPRGGRPSLSARGQARGSKQIKTCLSRKPALLVQPDRTSEAARSLPVLVVRIEGQTGTGRNRFGSQGRHRHGQVPYPRPL